MNKKAIKEFATWARTELIQRVKLRAERFGIVGDDAEPKLDSFRGYVFSDVEKKQRRTLAEKIARDGYENVMEEVAYTWFNRFCALRFMEVNEYLPSRVRVFSDSENNFKPQIVDEVRMVDLEGLDLDVVFEFQNKNDDEGLFKYLIITQCNALNAVLPGMFQKIDDYTELLFPDNLRREESVVGKMIAMIPFDDWKDQVQIVGWLYQFYNSEKKDEIFKALQKNVKISKENIPAATQLFTPDWIVRYMVENSLGRLWIEGSPNNELRKSWRYYLDEAKQEPEVQARLDEIGKGYAKLKPEDVKCLDPCCGSGHILVYMFDVLIQIYASSGYSERDAARLIVENNLFGLDIDERAAQLAYFSVMMKGRQYDARFLKRGVQPRVYAIAESNGLDVDARAFFCGGDRNLTKAVDMIVEELYDAKEYGSIIDVSEQDWDALYNRFDAIGQNDQYAEGLRQLLAMTNVAKILAGKYEVVCTNPPYMGGSGMNAKLTDFVKKNYPNSKNDLFAALIEKCGRFTKPNCFQAMITQHAWMFLNSYEKLRIAILDKDIVNMAHLGARAFEEIGGEVVQTTSFVLRQSKLSSKGLFCRLIEPNTQDGKEELFLSGGNRYETSQENFSKIPGAPIAYWVSDVFIRMFEKGKLLGSIADSKQGIATADNNRFLRLWHECDYTNFFLDCESHKASEVSEKRWYPYNKGGEYRKWYGNNDYVINWLHDGVELRRFKKSVIRNPNYYFRECFTWSLVSSGVAGFRYKESGSLFDVAGMSCFSKKDLLYLLGLCNSCVVEEILKVIAPTINYQCGDIANIPVIVDLQHRERIEELVSENIKLSREDWDNYEVSWFFKQHSLINILYNYKNSNSAEQKEIRYIKTIENSFELWQKDCDMRFERLKKNEEEINQRFIDIYGVGEELSADVATRYITVRKADKERDVKSLISYAVGCMFGRYSLDKPGLIYAGGDWDASQYKTFQADPDNVLPITDDDRFEDDLANRFFEFVRKVYGAETLEENLKFIADALGGSGSPREIIRNYFLNGFYADHVKIYQKRPIYWLFDSGKKNGFKCLIYMHRYAPDQLARIRTDYIHKLQQIYRRELDEIDDHLNATDEPKVVRTLEKKRAKLTAQAEEVRKYEEKIHHLADQKIAIDLDDGVKVNYAKFQNVLAPIK